MNKKTLYALAAFAVLALLAFFIMRAPEKGQRTGARTRPYPLFRIGMDFDTIEVTKGKETTVVRKNGDKYEVVSPKAYPAEEFAAKQAMESLEKLEWGDIVSEQKARHAEFEVDDKGVHVVAKSHKLGDKLAADSIIGKVVGANTLVRISGKDEVWQVAGSIRSQFDKDAAAWRDKTISSIKPDEVLSIEVNANVPRGGGLIHIKRNLPPDGGAAEATWSVETSPVKIDKLDSTIPAGIVSAMQSLKANEFADDLKPEDAGLGNAAQYAITARVKDEKVGSKGTTILIGKKKGEDDWYVTSNASPQIFVVKKYALERLMKAPIEFRDKTICNLAEGDVSEIAVTHGADSFTVQKIGSDWKATKPAGFEADGTKVTPMLAAFKEWKAASFAEDPSPATTGLGKPQAVITGKSKVTSCTLRIGNETKDKQNYYAQPAGSPDVYVLAKWNADRVLKKLDDIRKPGTKK